MNVIGVMARYTVTELARKRLTQVGLGGTVLFLALLTWVLDRSPFFTGALGGGLSRYAEASAALLLSLFFAYGLIAMFAAFSMAQSLGAQLESGVLAPVLGRPIPRSAVLLGIWAGHALLDAAYVLLLVGGAVIVVHSLYGYPVPAWSLPGAIGLMILEAWVVSAATLLACVFLPPMAGGLGVIGLYFLAFLAGMFAQLDYSPALHGGAPYLLHLNLVVNLIFPTDGLYRRAVWELTGGPLSVVSLLGENPIGADVVPSNPFLAYALLYVAAILALAVHWWRRRDL